jgi:hypothetical protein
MTSFQIGPRIDVGGLSLTVIEMSSVDHHRMGRGVFIQARKEPYAVLVRKADVAYAIGMDGDPVSTSQLAETGVWPASDQARLGDHVK